MKRRTFQAEGSLVGCSVVEALVSQLSVDAAQARALVEAGAVYLAGRRCREAGVRLRAGQVVAVVLEEAGRSPLVAAPAAAGLSILFEDEALIAVDKPAGITAQPTEARVGESLVDVVSTHLGRPAGLVHRLDRETSGVTVFGKTGEATTWLAGQFREGHARKRYLAATGPGLPASGTVDLPLSKDPSRPGRWRASRAANGVSALTGFFTLYSGPEFCLVELLPRTGRTHQLRAHLTALGAPILGDARYGGASRASELPAARCLLHAQGPGVVPSAHRRARVLRGVRAGGFAALLHPGGGGPAPGCHPRERATGQVGDVATWRRVTTGAGIVCRLPRRWVA